MVPVIFNLNIDLIYYMVKLLEGGLATKQVNTKKPLELLSWEIVSKVVFVKRNKISKLKSDSGPVNPDLPQPQSWTQK